MLSVQNRRRMTLNYVEVFGSLLIAHLQSNTGHAKPAMMFGRKRKNYIPMMSRFYMIASNMITLNKQDMDMQTYLGKVETCRQEFNEMMPVSVKCRGTISTTGEASYGFCTLWFATRA